MERPGLCKACQKELTSSKKFIFKIQLKNVSKPPVWRRVEVPCGISFKEFSNVILQSMDWAVGHLERSEIPGLCRGAGKAWLGRWQGMGRDRRGRGTCSLERKPYSGTAVASSCAMSSGLEFWSRAWFISISKPRYFAWGKILRSAVAWPSVFPR